MPRGIWSSNWLDDNAQRAYPLAAGASRTDEAGGFRLPDDVLLSLYLPVHAGLGIEAERFFLRELVVTGLGVSIGLAYDDDSAAPPVVATAAVSLAAHAEYASYTLAGVGDFDDAVGKVVFGSPAALAALPPGRYLFDAAAGRLDTDCVRPHVRGVSAIVVADGEDESERLTGDVRLTAGGNTRLSVSTGDDGVHVVRIDAIEGEGLSADCECDDDPGPCVRTINGVAPTADGAFALTGTDCLQITAADNGLVLADTCAQPCCGCDELEAVTADLARLADGAATLRGFVERLDAETSQMQLTVLGARLADQTCFDCDDVPSESDVG